MRHPTCVTLTDVLCCAGPALPQAGKLQNPAGNSLLAELVISGISVGTATAATNPIDVIKTRLQLRLGGVVASTKAPGLIQTGVTVVQKEGVSALWKGLPPAVTRSLLYGGLRLGLYGPFKVAFASGEQQQASFAAKLLAGSLSGAVAAALTNPAELVKTRLQAMNNQHKGTVAVVRHVVVTDGVRGLWRGAVPGMTRASMLTAAQCATYDEVKRAVMHNAAMQDTAATHLLCSMITGLITTTVTNPVDVIKTLVFVGGKKLGGPAAAARNIWRTEGYRGFFKGWSANYARLGPQTVITFQVNEYLRRLAGMPGL